MTKQELVKIIKDNFSDEQGNIRCDDLDFGEVDIVSLKGMKLKGSLHLSGAVVQGNIYQNEHTMSRGHIWQSRHILECGDLHQDEHNINGSLYQRWHTISEDLFQHNHYVAGYIVNADMTIGRKRIKNEEGNTNAE